MTDQVNVYMEPGGDRQVCASGGSIDVESGGEIDIEAGGALKLAGTAITSTAAELNSLDGLTGSVDGVAAGYVLARGTMTPTSGSHTIVTGLTTVVAATASLKGSPVITHMWAGVDIGDQAGTPAAGSILVKTWKPTAVDNATPTAATTPWATVDWIAVGT